jgi:hypothetical protein
MCGDRDVSIDVTSEIEFDNISCFEWFLLCYVDYGEENENKGVTEGY